MTRAAIAAGFQPEDFARTAAVLVFTPDRAPARTGSQVQRLPGNVLRPRPGLGLGRTFPANASSG
jgi:hypothetical protein